MQVIDGLRALGEDGLAAALAARPDLAATQPAHLGELAGRAMSPPAVRAGIDQLDSWTLAVVHLLGVAGDGAPLDEVAALARTPAGEPVEVADIERAVDELVRLLIVFRDGDRWMANPGLSTVIPSPGGLGRPAPVVLGRLQKHELIRLARALRVDVRTNARNCDLLEAIVAGYRDPACMAAALAGLTRRARALLDDAARHGAMAVSGWASGGGGPRNPADELVAAAMAVPVSWGRAEIPREVGLAVRGGIIIDQAVVAVPDLAPEPVEPDAVDHDAAGRAAATTQDLARLLAALEAAPGTPLKLGGLGAREVSKLAKATGIAADDVALLADLALVAGLLPMATGASVTPTAGAEQWLALPPGERWVHLAAAWLGSPRSPSTALRADLDGRTRPALMYETGVGDDWWTARMAALGPLAELEAGRRPTGPVVATVRWRRPLAWTHIAHAPDDVVEFTLDEAAAVGVTGRGALSSVGRRLLADDRAGAIEAATTLLPTPPAEITLQADLTAVVDAAAPHLLLVELRLLADTESTGPVEVLRFSPGSVRRGLDAGRTADELLAFLAGHAARGVPQPLDYLVRDTARRWGHLRAGDAGAYLRSDDERLLAEVVAHRGATRHGLRLIAPTVAVAGVPARQLLDWLRAIGHLPAAEGDDGLLLVAAPPELREQAGDLATVLTLDPRRRRSPGPAVGAGAADKAKLREEARRLLAAPVTGSGAGRDERGRFPGGLPLLFPNRAASVRAGLDLGAEVAAFIAAHEADFDDPEYVDVDLDALAGLDADIDPDDVEALLAELAASGVAVEVAHYDAGGREAVVIGRLASVGADVALLLAEPGGRPVLLELDAIIDVTALGPGR